jgi:CubicO group peptidase (beta-lactamase class C family)
VAWTSKPLIAFAGSDPRAGVPGSLGEYLWGGAPATAFWTDPREELTVVFTTRVIGSEARLTLRRDLRTLVYAAMTESFG